MDTNPKYWFGAKRYGWGWGLPTSWEGWVVLVAYCVLMFLAAVLMPVNRQPLAFFLTTMLLSGLLVAICWVKGEPPRWRWGGD